MSRTAPSIAAFRAASIAFAEFREGADDVASHALQRRLNLQRHEKLVLDHKNLQSQETRSGFSRPSVSEANRPERGPAYGVVSLRYAPALGRIKVPPHMSSPPPHFEPNSLQAETRSCTSGRPAQNRAAPCPSARVQDPSPTGACRTRCGQARPLLDRPARSSGCAAGCPVAGLCPSRSRRCRHLGQGSVFCGVGGELMKRHAKRYGASRVQHDLGAMCGDVAPSSAFW